MFDFSRAFNLQCEMERYLQQVGRAQRPVAVFSRSGGGYFRSEVYPDKVLPPQSVGIKRIILPGDNLTDLDDITGRIRAKLTFDPVEHVDEVLPSSCFRTERKQLRRAQRHGASLAVKCGQQRCAARLIFRRNDARG